MLYKHNHVNMYFICIPVLVEWASVFVDAIASSFLINFITEDGFVLVVNDQTHIWHTAVAYFYRVSVEKFSVFMVVWEVSIKKFEEVFADVCRDIFGERRVKPDYSSFSVSCLLRLWRNWVSILQNVIISPSVECFLIVVSFRFIESSLIMRQCIQPFFDGNWQLSDNVWKVIWFCVDVDGFVIGFSVWLISIYHFPNQRLHPDKIASVFKIKSFSFEYCVEMFPRYVSLLTIDIMKNCKAITVETNIFFAIWFRDNRQQIKFYKLI